MRLNSKMLQLEWLLDRTLIAPKIALITFLLERIALVTKIRITTTTIIIIVLSIMKINLDSKANCKAQVEV